MAASSPSADAGAIFSSRDGRVWKQEFSGTEAALAAVAFGKNLFVAGGDDGLLLVSFDGKPWSPQKSGTHSRINRVAFHGDGFYTSSNLIRLKSSDGIVWLPEQSAETSVVTNTFPLHSPAPKF
ncbi:MAG: hypothetical protein HY043_15915 [Verrucomicrobia bacterium]|nr:hypothetical protein [Verrucomicrobiota bacterium]